MARTKTRLDRAEISREYRKRQKAEREGERRDAQAWRRLCEAVRLNENMSAEEMLKVLFNFSGSPALNTIKTPRTQ